MPNPEPIVVHNHIHNDLGALVAVLVDIRARLDKLEAAQVDVQLVAQVTENMKQLNRAYDAERAKFAAAITPTTS